MSISKVLAALMLAPLLAVAQTTQPVYVRPSKGSPISLTVAATAYTPILDMTAFAAVQIAYGSSTWVVDNLNQFVKFRYFCPPQPELHVQTFTSPSKDSGFVVTQSPDADKVIANFGPCPATITFIVTPLPISPLVRTTPVTSYPALLVDTPTAVAASPAPATVILWNATTGVTGVELQNMGTFPVACGVGTSSDLVSLTRYSFVLAAGTAAGNGTGGKQALRAITGALIYCIANGGASSVAMFPQ